MAFAGARQPPHGSPFLTLEMQDYYSIPSTSATSSSRGSGFRRHHTTIKDYTALRQTWVMERTAHGQVSLPASCMILPLLQPWPAPAAFFEARALGTQVVGVRLGVQSLSEVAVKGWMLNVSVGQLGSFELLVGEQSPGEGNDDDDYLTVSSAESGPGVTPPLRVVPLLIRVPTLQTNYTVISFSSNCAALQRTAQLVHEYASNTSKVQSWVDDTASLTAFLEGETVLAAASGERVGGESAARASLFDPSLFAAIECEPLS